MDTGSIIAIVAVLLFYMRMMGMQWGKAKRLREQHAQDLLDAQSKKKDKKSDSQPQKPREIPGVRVKSWPMVIAGLVLCVAGAVFSAVGAVSAFWWIPITLGVLILTFSFK